MQGRKGKRGIAFEVLAKAMLVLVVAVLLIFLYIKYFTKVGDEVVNSVDSSGDCDRDGVANLLDKCCNCDGPGDQVNSFGCNLDPVDKDNYFPDDKKKCTPEQCG